MTGFAIKRGRLNREMRNRKIGSAAALARDAKVHKTTACRVLSGESLAGAKFAMNLTAAWGLEINDLFEAPKTRRRKAAET